MTIAQRKRELRARSALGPPLAARERRAAGEALARRVLEWPLLGSFERVALFASTGAEIATEALDRRLRQYGLAVLYPRCVADRQLAFALCRREELAIGRYGLLEPDAGHETVVPGRADLVCVPGLAFDRAGRRLGRGGGYYDRCLATLRAGPRPPVFAGLAHRWQLVERVPCEPHDEPVDWVLCEDGVVGGSSAVAGHPRGERQE